MSTVSLSKAILLYVIVSLFLFFEMAVQVSPSVMSNQLMQDLHMGAFGLGVMSSVYFYSYTLMQVPSGLLFDRFQPRMIITLSLLMCALGTLLFGLSPTIYISALARLLMGLGSAFAFVSVLVVTADLFKPNYFALMTGITQMLAAFGAMSGQLPISTLVALIGWRMTMLSLAAIGAVLAMIVFQMLCYKKTIKGCDVKNECAHISFNIKAILKNKQTWWVALYACLLWAPMSGFASLWGVPFLVNVDQLHPHQAAFLCSLMWLGLAFASPLLGAVSMWMNRRVIPLAFSALLGVIAFACIWLFTLPVWLIGLLLFFAGAACAGQALSFSVVKEMNADARRATAIAFNNMAVVISGAVFQPLIGRLLDNGRSSVFAGYEFRSALSVIFIAYVVAFIVATFCIRETRCEDA